MTSGVDLVLKLNELSLSIGNARGAISLAESEIGSNPDEAKYLKEISEVGSNVSVQFNSLLMDLCILLSSYKGSELLAATNPIVPPFILNLEDKGNTNVSKKI